MASTLNGHNITLNTIFSSLSKNNIWSFRGVTITLSPNQSTYTITSEAGHNFKTTSTLKMWRYANQFYYGDWGQEVA